MTGGAAPIKSDRFDRYRAIRAFRLAIRSLDWLAERAVMAMMAVMLGIVSSQVFMRYALNRSLDWADEAATLLFVWTVFLALPLALRNGGHIVMELLLSSVSRAGRDRLYRAMAFLSSLMMAVVAREAFVLTVDNWDEIIPSLHLSGGLYYLPVGLGIAHTALRSLEICFAGEPKRVGVIE
ncbi:MAG: TRAP transporter small permease [Tagaea sp.]|nr:TRAP transporter small permease [Tagaea sp.]